MTITKGPERIEGALRVEPNIVIECSEQEALLLHRGLREIYSHAGSSEEADEIFDMLAPVNRMLRELAQTKEIPF